MSKYNTIHLPDLNVVWLYLILIFIADNQIIKSIQHDTKNKDPFICFAFGQLHPASICGAKE
jgi:hypothetical protein